MRSWLRVLVTQTLAFAIVLCMTGVFRAADKPDGSAIYKQKCSMCHGPDGKGFPAIKTPDLTDHKWQTSNSDKEMIEVVKNGKKGTPMPPFAEKLKDDEIHSVVKFIRTFDSSKKK